MFYKASAADLAGTWAICRLRCIMMLPSLNARGSMYFWLWLAVVLVVGVVLGRSTSRIADEITTLYRLAKEPNAPYS